MARRTPDAPGGEVRTQPCSGDTQPCSGDTQPCSGDDTGPWHVAIRTCRFDRLERLQSALFAISTPTSNRGRGGGATALPADAYAPHPLG